MYIYTYVEQNFLRSSHTITMKLTSKVIKNMNVFNNNNNNLCYFAVLLQNIVVQVVEHHSVNTGPDYGHVFLFIRTVDAYEHASRVQNHNNAGSGRPSVQFLSSLVRRHIPC